jgi:glutamine synthetase
MIPELELLSKLPTMEIHNTDRNRTSPFAFTGNKFEIRMVGSSANCAGPMTVMNTIMGDQLKTFKKDIKALMDAGKTREDAMLTTLRRYIRESQPILFEGDGYSDEWKEEAAKRGLPNVPNSALALDAYVTDKAIKLYTESGVLTEKEINAHQIVRLEKYSKDITIESDLLNEMVVTQILPAAIEYQNTLLTNVAMLRELDLDEDTYETQLEMVKKISKHINGARKAIKKMNDAVHKAEEADSPREEAVTFGLEVKPTFDEIRKHADALEHLIDDQNWTLPKMRELLFVK